MIPSPNIWEHPDTYELLNRAADPERLVWSALAEVAPWAGRRVVDVGCGTGFHLAEYARSAAAVVGIEPHAGLVERARARTAGRSGVTLHRAGAERLPLADRSVDAVHARWAYFLGPGCEAGIAEAFRALRPGGVLAVVDVDATGAGYGEWFRQAWPRHEPSVVDRFWARLWFARRALAVVWRFERREDLEAVLAIELPPDVARRAIRATSGVELAVPTVLRWRTAGLA